MGRALAVRQEETRRTPVIVASWRPTGTRKIARLRPFPVSTRERAADLVTDSAKSANRQAEIAATERSVDGLLALMGDRARSYSEGAFRFVAGGRRGRTKRHRRRDGSSSARHGAADGCAGNRERSGAGSTTSSVWRASPRVEPAQATSWAASGFEDWSSEPRAGRAGRRARPHGGDMKYPGMDVHGKATVYCLLDAQGQVVERGEHCRRRRLS